MKAKCPEICGMVLDCEHICNLDCQHQIPHSKISCAQPCRRNCPVKHPCPKVCFEKCGGCQVEVLKRLPCGHKVSCFNQVKICNFINFSLSFQKFLKCSEAPRDAYCSILLLRWLDDCKHFVTAQCSAKTKGWKCSYSCERVLCADGHQCKKFCWEACGPCHEPVQRELDCGHLAQMECFRDPMKTKCQVPKEVILPDCHHRVQATCGDKQEEIVCTVSCDLRLDCGHQCTQKCHVKDDPDHIDYRCDKKCERNKANCKSNHKCNKKCHEECDRCWVTDNRTLPCGHNAFTECGIDDKDIFCR